MEIIVKGRNVEVPEHFREHVAEKLEKATKLDSKIIHVDVELAHEPNPRQQDHQQRVEITCQTRGTVVRAEASARDFYSALDEAVLKFNTRLRRFVDRRKVQRSGGKRPLSVAEATADLPTGLPGEQPEPEPAFRGVGAAPVGGVPAAEGEVVEAGGDDEPWRIVREKEHSGTPMTIDDALFQMELVGHDFYLFMDKETGRPSVVYRRRAFDYGVISLGDPAE